ncbi:MAG: 4Fe-4S dicluster domain-containing protein [Desulfatirhabdiaceae bacterium]
MEDMDVYKRLAVHLDNLPAGYPATESGIELKILKKLFTPLEARIAAHLIMMPEPVSAIAGRAGMTEAELSPILFDMSKKGLIYRSGKGGVHHYMAAQFVVGIWEYHVNSLDEELIQLFNEYCPDLMEKAWSATKTKQLRVIPVSQSISAEMRTMPYDAAEKIIKSQSKIVVCPCICRTEHKMVGKGCGKPIEVCLTFGSGAYYYEQNGLGRDITQSEALDILAKGLEAGLVLQPGNSQKPSNICMCCGCCCQILKNLNRMDEPAKWVHTNYFAEVLASDCTGCGLCAERCQMKAIVVDDVARVEAGRCIGCGLCVTACNFDAIQLREKPGPEQWTPPRNVVETYMNMAQERGMI